MGKQVAPNYRGKGVSKTKFKKDGTPKHAGNFSAMTAAQGAGAAPPLPVTYSRDSSCRLRSRLPFLSCEAGVRMV